MELLKPPSLAKGDLIGVISPSSPRAGEIPERFNRGVRAIENLGYSVKVGKNARQVLGHVAGTRQMRIDDLHAMFEDTQVKAIVTAIGGYNSNDLLDLVDYDLIRQNPKIFCGYSDITFLHCGIHSQTGLVTFYGPQVMSQFADFGGPIRYTIDCFERVLTGYSKAIGRMEQSMEFTCERLEWGKEDVRPRQLIPSSGWQSLKPGRAKGRLIGGHLRTITDLAGTRYFPDFRGKIFFWEDAESNTAMTNRALSHLRMLGILDQIKGMLVGRVNPNGYRTIAKDYDLRRTILDATNEYDFPIIAGMEFGHTDPMMTIPFGIEAVVDAENFEFSLLEPAVRPSTSQ